MAVDLILGSIQHHWSRGEIVPPTCSGSDDPLVWTPSAVRAELDRVRDVVDVINQEMSQALNSSKISDAEWSGWFRTYQTAHKLTDDASTMWGSNVLAARRHEQDALNWRDLLKSRGATLIGPNNLGRSPGSNLFWPAVAVTAASATVFYIFTKKKG